MQKFIGRITTRIRQKFSSGRKEARKLAVKLCLASYSDEQSDYKASLFSKKIVIVPEHKKVHEMSQLHQFNHHHNHPAMLRPGGDSPRNSDEQSDYGGNEVSDKLTNIHLRKAKLSELISFSLPQCCPERVFNSELN